jgi:hypothetical protein
LDFNRHNERNDMLFGGYVDANGYNGPNATVGATCIREHLYQFDAAGKMVWPPTDGPIPARWGPPPAYAPNAVWCLTLYPNADQLLTGQLDAQIKTFVNSAPAGKLSFLTAYAEADGSNEQWKPVGIDHAKMMAIHAKMYQLCFGTNVRYGIVVCGTGATSKAYMQAPCSWLGLDIYQWGDPFAMLDQFLANAQAASGYPKPSLMIAETNTNVPALRPEWFLKVFTWLKNYELRGGNVRAMMQYWNPGGPLSGPWLPTDTATINALKAIAELAPIT